MNNIIFLLTKDCMACESLPVYGNKYWNTPNIDELAAKGTVFYKHYTAGASTAMALSAMLSGHYPYEFKNRKIYIKVEPSEYPSVFDDMQKKGYECHLIWDAFWMETAWKFIREFGDERKTTIHNLSIAQHTGHNTRENHITRNNEFLEKTYKQIYETLESIDLGKKQFIWMHLPHILKGRKSWMDDMDVFDNIVGYVRRLVGDDNIFISTDHGHMNMHKGIAGYGFHVYEPIVHIPLITPRIDGISEVNDLTCNIDLPKLLTERKIIKRKYAIAETTYYAQPKRKLAVITERFKYIYNKSDKSEELYDLKWDPEENYNILKYDYYDKDRKKRIVYEELYFYPYKDEALKELPRLRQIKNEIWRDAPKWYEWYGIVRKKLAFLKKFIPNRI